MLNELINFSLNPNRAERFALSDGFIALNAAWRPLIRFLNQNPADGFNQHFQIKRLGEVIIGRQPAVPRMEVD